jgi:hypothetical protein
VRGVSANSGRAIAHVERCADRAPGEDRLLGLGERVDAAHLDPSRTRRIGHDAHDDAVVDASSWPRSIGPGHRDARRAERVRASVDDRLRRRVHREPDRAPRPMIARASRPRSRQQRAAHPRRSAGRRPRRRRIASPAL